MESHQIDTVDSIRLKNKMKRPSLITIIDPGIENITAALSDLDINALDAELKNITHDISSNLKEYRSNPQNLALCQLIQKSKAKLVQLKSWTSLLNTEDGMKLIQQQMKNEEEQVNKRKYEIDELLKSVKALSSVDICFLVDCTGSMQDYIDATRDNIKTLTNTISNLFRTKPRLAFIGYRDISDNENNLIKFEFTDDIDAFSDFLSHIETVGGDDICEDVFGGLQAVNALSWYNPNRLLIHICDSPCHGRDYHDQQWLDHPEWDKHPKGDPKNRELSKLLLDIKRHNVKYFSIQLNNDRTCKMFQEFKFIYGTLPEIDVKNANDIIQSITKTTTSVIMNTIHDTMSTFQTTATKKTYNLLASEPKWNLIPANPVKIIEIIMPRTLDEILQGILYVGEGSGTMKIASNPFAQGSLRYAFYGQFASDQENLISVVYKELINADPHYNTLTVYKQHLEIHVIAQFMAERFNIEQRLRFCNPVEIFYADADIVQQKNDLTKFYQVEARFNQSMQKWNNNSGGVHMVDYSTTLQAFSHWTYHFTAGRLMVVDLQGVRSDNVYLLTDPAIHFDDLKRYKEARTNLGAKGMREFFRTHVCSKVCTELGLPKITNNIDENLFKDYYVCSGKYEMQTITSESQDNDDIIIISEEDS
ncbi:unnamed protein product [Didymodactylos carnosus]|uniref:Alpha-type protein kinase domain-containing protein n=1 Tax=Didymodactylos carnosus TaxID=1234261 RepID=A0A8S2GP90_9BILA|nr:unnamed protein product [Didymodactylos carnosus]CAF3543091.1 unnamed protein product [Didymodactylos carnosus]